MSSRFNDMITLRSGDYEEQREVWQEKYNALAKTLGFSMSNAIKSAAGECVFCNSPKIVTGRP